MAEQQDNALQNEVVAAGSSVGSPVRGALRLLLLLIFVVILLPLCTLIVLGAGLLGRNARYRTVVTLTGPFCRLFAALVGLRLKIRGQRNPNARVFVGNHVGYVDILTAGAAVSGVFVSRHDVKDWPVIGLFARLAGTVFLDRSSLRSALASSDALRQAANDGLRVALFPEGHTTSGDGVGPFRAFLFGALAGTPHPVQPFTIRYTHIGSEPITRRNRALVYWYDPAPPFHVHGWRLLKLPYVRTELVFHEAVMPPSGTGKEDIRKFAEELREIVAEGVSELRD